MTVHERTPQFAEDFEATAMPCRGDLVRAASSMVGSRTEAEDVVQDVFLQAWKSRARFAPGTDFKAWMFGILFNVVRHHRRKRLKFRLVQSDEFLEHTAVYEPPVPQNLSDENVVAALNKIPRQYRQVVLLSDVYEFSYKEIQQSLSIPPGTVMSRLSRGRKLLRTHLAGIAAAAGICAAG